MKVLLIGATGMIGSRIAAELVARGHDVTAASRRGAAVAGARAEECDASDPGRVAELASGQDAVVLAISPPRDGSEPAGPLLAAGRAVLDGTRKAGVRRLVVVGGAGSTLLPSGERIVDQPDFPALYKRESLAQADLLDLVRAEGAGLDWTYISPAEEIGPGERTGTFRTGGDKQLFDADGRSFISAEDYADGLANELERGDHIGRRILFAY